VKALSSLITVPVRTDRGAAVNLLANDPKPTSSAINAIKCAALRSPLRLAEKAAPMALSDTCSPLCAIEHILFLTNPSLSSQPSGA
jgi:hypothetical protein